MQREGMVVKYFDPLDVGRPTLRARCLRTTPALGETSTRSCYLNRWTPSPRRYVWVVRTTHTRIRVFRSPVYEYGKSLLGGEAGALFREDVGMRLCSRLLVQDFVSRGMNAASRHTSRTVRGSQNSAFWRVPGREEQEVNFMSEHVLPLYVTQALADGRLHVTRLSLNLSGRQAYYAIEMDVKGWLPIKVSGGRVRCFCSSPCFGFCGG